MALSDTNRQRVWAAIMETGIFPPSILKPDLRAAVDGFDDGLDSVASTLNTALPQPYRGAASVAQKAFLSCVVSLARAYEAGMTKEQVRQALQSLLTRLS